jgi:hypothetical protein
MRGFKTIGDFWMLKFQGSLDDLQDIVMRCAILGEWRYHKKGRFYRFQAATGAILNWWPTTGTINFQGHDAEQFVAILQHALAGVAQSEPGQVSRTESVWEAVPGPTQTQRGPREAASFAWTDDRRKLASQPSPRLAPRPVKLLAAPDRR